jgi:hypothetical protein
MGFARELVAAPLYVATSLTIFALVAVAVVLSIGGRLAYRPGRSAAPQPAGGIGQLRVR